jgi:hypothetical protein
MNNPYQPPELDSETNGASYFEAGRVRLGILFFFSFSMGSISNYLAIVLGISRLKNWDSLRSVVANLFSATLLVLFAACVATMAVWNYRELRKIEGWALWFFPLAAIGPSAVAFVLIYYFPDSAKVQLIPLSVSVAIMQTTLLAWACRRVVGDFFVIPMAGLICFGAGLAWANYLLHIRSILAR